MRSRHRLLTQPRSTVGDRREDCAAKRSRCAPDGAPGLGNGRGNDSSVLRLLRVSRFRSCVLAADTHHRGSQEAQIASLRHVLPRALDGLMQIDQINWSSTVLCASAVQFCHDLGDEQQWRHRPRVRAPLEDPGDDRREVRRAERDPHAAACGLLNRLRRMPFA